MNNLNDIIEIIRIYAKNYARNNPTWNHSELINRIRDKALGEAEDYNIRLSEEDLALITELSLRGLQGEMDDATYFEDDKEPQQDWLTLKIRNDEIKFTHWNAYRNLLSFKPNWTEGDNGTLTKLDLNTQRILSKLADPNGPPSVRKGMVVGNVQSGKTANYIGLISKAADAGYKVIVVLAGMLDDLRIQTQIRLEEGFIGKNGSNQELVGVGEVDRELGLSNKLAFTNRESDFKTKTAKVLAAYNFCSFQNTCIFVIKKNTTILKNLNKWLSAELRNNSITKADGSLLLIDDEADNASINTKAGTPYLNRKKIDKEYDLDDIDPSKINGQIRKLIQKFNICTYVGYTATPFANIFISPENQKKMFGEDLFPKHFIQYIKPPSTYFGPSKLFVEKKFPNLFRYIPFDEINNSTIDYCIPKKHRKDFRLGGLPKSLKTAILSFIIATSVRKIRLSGVAFHSSMLVNPSTFTDVQISVKGKIQDYIDLLKIQLKRVNDSFIIPEIKEVWDNDFKDIQEFNNWDSVLNTIKGVVEEIKVVLVNTRKSEKLEYEKYPEKRKIIVVGGFSLSRGLTLEGLITSYYLRYSKMYDSMLQMGRWFGYRMGYEDLCKIYLSKESHEDFEIISNAVEELSLKFEEMQALNATPMDFGLQVRTDAQNKRLMITAKNKMGAAQKVKRSFSYSGRLVQNYCFERNKISQNLKYVDHFHTKIKKEYHTNKLADPKYYGYRDVQGSLIYELIDSYHISELNDTITKDTLIKYFKKRLKYELKNWHIIFDSNINKNSRNGIYNSAGVNIARVGRQVSTKTTNLKKTIFLSKPSSRAICSPNITDKVFTELEINSKRNPSYSKKMLGQVLANKFRQPVLVIAFCNPTFNEKEEYSSESESEAIKKEIESLNTIPSINFLFPYSELREDLVEVYENADITDLYQNDSFYMEDGDD